jgi:hypothetical protein
MRILAGKLADVLMLLAFSTLAMFACWAMQPEHRVRSPRTTLRRGQAQAPVYTPAPRPRPPQ